MFHVVPGDAYTGDGVDIAIARLDPRILQVLGKEPIPLSRIRLPGDITEAGLCGIATGFPEANRRIEQKNKRLNDLHLSALYAFSEFDRIDRTALRLFGELDQRPAGDNLSGMSGGPIFWSTAADWGLAGIVYNGRDLVGSDLMQKQSALPAPTIWIDGESISTGAINDWIGLIPTDEEFLSDASKMLYIPESMR